MDAIAMLVPYIAFRVMKLVGTDRRAVPLQRASTRALPLT
jgi:hypothetical protein